MSDEAYTKKFSNITDMPIRTRLALWFIVLAIKICEPWQYAHQFQADLDTLRDILKGKSDEETKA